MWGFLLPSGSIESIILRLPKSQRLRKSTFPKFPLKQSDQSKKSRLLWLFGHRSRAAEPALPPGFISGMGRGLVNGLMIFSARCSTLHSGRLASLPTLILTGSIAIRQTWGTASDGHDADQIPFFLILFDKLSIMIPKYLGTNPSRRPYTELLRIRYRWAAPSKEQLW